MKNNVIVGIDPGKNGAIVVLENGKLVEFNVIPTIKGKEFDLWETKRLFKELQLIPNCHLVIEDVHAIFGSAAGSTFNFGWGVGMLQTFAVAFDLSFTLVQPKTWQKIAWAGIPEIRKPSKENKNGKTIKGQIDTKAMSELAIKRLFPNDYHKFKASDRCSKLHDGIIDACLIAYYGYIQNL